MVKMLSRVPGLRLLRNRRIATCVVTATAAVCLLGAAGLAMTTPLFIPSRWRRAPRVPGYAALGESTPASRATASPGTGGPGLDGAIAGLTAPGGDSSVMITGWEQTRPQQRPVTPPGGSQAPGSLPDEG